MPYTNVHLRVAKAILESGLSVRDRTAFYAGSIAPDAIHLKPGFVPQDKADMHLVCRWAKGIDKNEWRANVLRAKKLFEGTDFGIGYALHLLTDVRWAERLDLTFIERYHGPLPEYGIAYRNNMLACEAELYASDPLTDVYGLLAQYHENTAVCPVTAGVWIEKQLALRGTAAPDCCRYIKTSEIETFIGRSVPELLAEWRQL